MRTDYLGLEAFLLVAELGSFRAGANMLNLSKTAISHRIRKLEESLGAQLFIRAGRDLRLTETGAELLPVARELITGVQAHLSRIRAKQDMRRDALAIGCLPIEAVTILPPVLKEFAEHHPNVAVKIFDLSPMRIEEHVRNREIEFGITNVSAYRGDMRAIEVYSESYSVVCPPDHPLSSRSLVEWSDLYETQLIQIGAPAGYHRLMLSQALEKNYSRLMWSHEVLHINTALALVAEGVGLAIAPLRASHGEVWGRLKVLPVHNPAVSRRIGILSRQDNQNPKYMPIFEGLLRKHTSWDSSAPATE